MAATAFALAAAPAEAAVTHRPLFQLGEIPAKGPLGEPVALPGPLGRMESVTLDSGHLWVAEGELLQTSRVDEFDAATGAFIAQPVHVEAPTQAESKLPTCYGYGCGTGIAVGHGLGEAAVYVGGEKHGVSVVSVFNEAGALKGTWNGAATPGGSFGIITEPDGRHVGTVTDVAVDNSSNPLDPGKGDVFVAMGRRGVIDVFHPESDGEERYVGQIKGVSPSEPFGFTEKIVIDEANGDLFVIDRGQSSTVDVFEPTGPGAYVFARKLTGPPPSGVFGGLETIAVDSVTGAVYLAEFLSGDYRIAEYSAAGTYLGHVDNIPDAFAIAVDPASHNLYARNVVYGPDLVIPDVSTGPPSNLKPESVLLSGTVNPDNAGNATCQFEWGTTTALGKIVPCSGEVANGEGPVSVQASLGGVERNRTYYYRLRATNQNGTNPGEAWQDMSFTTFGTVLSGEFVADVTSTSAELGARINPGQRPTSYYFQYGPSAEYGHETPTPPGEAIGSGTADVAPPSLHVQGLSPSTSYHYRLVAVSEVNPGEFETLYGEDRTFTTQASSSTSSLADGRQWELVSPANKLGALIGPLGGGLQGVVQAASAGNAIAYRTTSPTEDEPPGYARTVEVLSTHGAAGWSSQDLSAPHNQGGGDAESIGGEYRLFSEDLSRAAVQPASSAFTPLSPEASEATAYLRTNYLGGGVEDHCRSSCYQPLVTGKPGFANVPAGTVFGEEPNGVCEAFTCGPYFEGANADLSHVVLSSPVQLTSTPAPTGGKGLYEWSAGKLQLLDVLPKGEEGPAVLAGVPTKAVRHSISNNGERVILEGGATGGRGLYLRDAAAGETIRLDVPQGGTGPSENVSYMDASNDASRIFFLDSGRLTANASASGADLYEYALNAPAGSRLKDLSADLNAGRSANVAMVIGASEDGSYLYFAAGGALAPGAVEGECPSGPPNKEHEASCNLYVSHEGVTRLVSVLPAEDVYDWQRSLYGLFARVSPNGRWLAFMSAAELTGYDTHDAVSGKPDAEVYLYDEAADRVVCASCNPTGARPVGEEFVNASLVSYGGTEGRLQGKWVAANVPPWEGPRPALGTFDLHQPRYLSDTGRLFFNSPDALVPHDVDGTQDVYEYEPAGAGDCGPSSATFVQRSDGCLTLVSGGASPQDSAFLDASETGSDVFFLTQAQLASQDYDTAYDVYDAHECTATAPCSPTVSAPPPCVTEASCKAAPTPQPALYGAPASATFSGTGNIAPASSPVVKTKPKSKPRSKSAKCRKGSRKRRCVKARKARHRGKKGTKAARSRRGGGR